MHHPDKMKNNELNYRLKNKTHTHTHKAPKIKKI